MNILVFDWKENIQTVIAHMARAAQEYGQYMREVPHDWQPDDQHYVIVSKDWPIPLDEFTKERFNNWFNREMEAVNAGWGLLG